MSRQFPWSQIRFSKHRSQSVCFLILVSLQHPPPQPPTPPLTFFFLNFTISSFPTFFYYYYFYLSSSLIALSLIWSFFFFSPFSEPLPFLFFLSFPQSVCLVKFKDFKLHLLKLYFPSLNHVVCRAGHNHCRGKKICVCLMFGVYLTERCKSVIWLLWFSRFPLNTCSYGRENKEIKRRKKRDERKLFVMGNLPQRLCMIMCGRILN